MKKAIALLLALVMVFALAACSNSGAESTQPAGADKTDPPSGEGKTVGFVTFGLGGDFFQQLADAYVAKMEEIGWKAYYADGQFDPTTQIEAAENYIAMNVDVLVIWSVAPEAMGSVIDQAMEAGIKVIAFVAPTEKYDVVMISDNADLAACCAKLAAKWIDETFAAAEDHSVPVAVLSCRTAETGVVQADVLIEIEQYSQKAKFVKEVQCQDETIPTGQKAAEDLYITNPEIQVFLSAHSGLATGANNYFTSLNSPVTDYSNMGIFCINGDNAVADLIKASVSNEAPMRGMVLTGSVDDTARELMEMIVGITDGTIPSGHTQMAGTTFVYADTIDEYLSTGAVTSVTNEDFN